MRVSVLVWAVILSIPCVAACAVASDETSSLFERGEAAAVRGDLAAAEVLLRSAVQAWDMSDVPRSAVERSQYVCAMNTLATILHTAGRRNESEALCRRALQVAGTPSDTADTLVVLAGILADAHDHAEADRLASRALKIYEKTVGPEDPSVVRALNVLVDIRAAHGALDDADRLLRRAVRAAERPGASVASHAAVLSRRGLVRLAQGRYADAEALLEKSLDLGEEALGADHPALFGLWQGLGDCYRLRNRPADAQAAYERSLETGERLYGPSHLALVPSLSGLAGLAERDGAEARAESLYRRAMEIAARDVRPSRRAVSIAALAGFYARHQEAGRAEPLFVEALGVLDAASDVSRSERRTVLEGLRALYASSGRPKEAARLSRSLKRLASARPMPGDRLAQVTISTGMSAEME